MIRVLTIPGIVATRMTEDDLLDTTTVEMTGREMVEIMTVVIEIMIVVTGTTTVVTETMTEDMTTGGIETE